MCTYLLQRDVSEKILLITKESISYNNISLLIRPVILKLLDIIKLSSYISYDHKASQTTNLQLEI